MNKKVLLLVDTGMLGQSIRKVFEERGYTVVGASRTSKDHAIDLTCDDSIKAAIREEKPDMVINSAAIVSLDGCENNPADAYMINGRLPGIVAECCRETGTYFIQISTDHYFMGDGDAKHNENDKVIIVNEYARSKYLRYYRRLVRLREEQPFVVLRRNVTVKRTNAPTSVRGFLDVPFSRNWIAQAHN